MSREPLNGFAPNPQGRRVWLLARTNLNDKVKGQGYQGHSHHPTAETEWNALAANNVMQMQTGPSHEKRGCVRAVYVCKTSSALVLSLCNLIFTINIAHKYDFWKRADIRKFSSLNVSTCQKFGDFITFVVSMPAQSDSV